jgi:SAM-dependent MidA family methyltransferase
MTALPPPSSDALAHSARLIDLIRAEIAGGGGWLAFARYMELALYAPGLGYYTAGASKFGAAGDFVTAQELTPLFGRTLAHSLAAVLAECAGGEVIELGAGSGRLAVDVLLELERLGALPTRYAILEVSADLRERQRRHIGDAAPHLADRLEWLESLPERVTGVVVANEVLDALPVHLLHWTTSGLMERGVALDGPGFAWVDRPCRLPLSLELQTLKLPAPYFSELNLAAGALVASLAERLEHGALMFIDYGFPRAEYYHPQRHMGTLRAHYRHHALDDPFYLPGLCDLTAHVDFTAVAEAGVDAGLSLYGYTNQANFLLDAGLLDLMRELPAESTDYLRASRAVQKLIQPQEMGELFKVIALGRGIETALPGFRRGERSASL